MNGNSIPDDNHVVRYVKATAYDPETGRFNGIGFAFRPDDMGQLSSNWLEFTVGDEAQRLAYIFERKRITWKKNGRLARLNVGSIRARFADDVPDLQVIEDALLADAKYPLEDLSHALIATFPGDEFQLAVYSDMLAECVDVSYETEAG